MTKPFENADSRDTNWFEDWFDEDYLKLYSNRDEGEAEVAVETALRLLPDLANGAVLDLGCGTGRHLGALRRVNQRAFGIDLSKTMLRHAKDHLVGSLVRADMRRLPIAASKLDGACLWFTPFGYFGSEGNAALLQSLADAIRPNGILLVDFLNSAHVLSAPKVDEEMKLDGAFIQINRVVNNGRIEKRIKITYGGQERVITESIQLYSPDELGCLISGSGFRFAKSWGDYRGSDFDAGRSKRFISTWRREGRGRD
jgi:SAM-dependent methyltransferase